MGLISVAGQHALFPVWLMMWENLIYGQFDILSLNKCSPVNAEINKSRSRFLVAHLSPVLATRELQQRPGYRWRLRPRWRSVPADPPASEERAALLQPLHGQWCYKSQQYSTSYLSMLNLYIIFSFSTFYLLLLYFKSQRNNIY